MIIGRNKKAMLESILPSQRTAEQQKMLDDHEFEHAPPEEVLKRRIDYQKKISEESKDMRIEIDSSKFFSAFQFNFEKNEGKPLNTESESLQDYAPLIYYFSGDERFFDCKNLSKLSKPSFEKGLLIVGNYGNGKTATLRASQFFLVDFALLIRTALGVISSSSSSP